MISKAKAGFVALGLASAITVAGQAAAQDSGFYAGLHFGQSEQNGQCEGVPISCDEKDTGWKILGGFQVNRNFAVELGYANLGEASASGIFAGVPVSISSEITAFDLTAVGMLPLMDRLSAYARLGLFRAEAELSSNIPGASGDDSGTGLTFGIGLRYDITRNLGVRAEWQRYQEVSDEIDVDLLSIGVLFKF